jgi:putative ABC transport system substrate-binding protein
MRRIGALINPIVDDPEVRARLAAFVERLRQFGSTDGHNVRIDIRWSAGNADETRKNAAALVALAPDVILVNGSAAAGPLLRATRTIPVVFVNVIDPVGAGFVENLSRPGGNATGFTSFEFALSGKWVELLKEIAPDVRRVAVIRDPLVSSGPGQFGAIQTAAPSFGMEVSPIDPHDASEIERAVTAFARGSMGGMIVAGSAAAFVNRALIVKLAARHKLPAVYWDRSSVIIGGLIAYGPERIEQYQRAAGYVDRILKGERPADLPVQAPTKYELAINLKSAMALGLEVPPTLLARADEVIE